MKHYNILSCYWNKTTTCTYHTSRKKIYCVYKNHDDFPCCSILAYDQYHIFQTLTQSKTTTHVSIPKLPKLQVLPKIKHSPKPSHLAPSTQTNKPTLTTSNHPNQPTPNYCPLPHPVPTKNSNYLYTRTCDSGSSITLVLVGPNTQPYTDNKWSELLPPYPHHLSF